jgi:hypothetical protein
MGIGISIFLLAVGAILAFAVEGELSGLDIDVVGVILMVVGAIGLCTAVAFLSRGGRTLGSRTIVETGRAVPTERTVVREERTIL